MKRFAIQYLVREREEPEFLFRSRAMATRAEEPSRALDENDFQWLQEYGRVWRAFCDHYKPPTNWVDFSSRLGEAIHREATSATARAVNIASVLREYPPQYLSLPMAALEALSQCPIKELATALGERPSAARYLQQLFATELRDRTAPNAPTTATSVGEAELPPSPQPKKRRRPQQNRRKTSRKKKKK